MIYIHEDWCPRCRNRDQNTWTDSEVIQLSSNFVNINVVGTKQGTLNNYSKPPLIVFTDPQGRVIVEQNAELSASQVTALQRQVLAEEPASSPSAKAVLQPQAFRPKPRGCPVLKPSLQSLAYRLWRLWYRASARAHDKHAKPGGRSSQVKEPDQLLSAKASRTNAGSIFSAILIRPDDTLRPRLPSCWATCQRQCLTINEP